jgi:hypothetical protein
VALLRFFGELSLFFELGVALSALLFLGKVLSTCNLDKAPVEMELWYLLAAFAASLAAIRVCSNPVDAVTVSGASSSELLSFPNASSAMGCNDTTSRETTSLIGSSSSLPNLLCIGFFGRGKLLVANGGVEAMTLP